MLKVSGSGTIMNWHPYGFLTWDWRVLNATDNAFNASLEVEWQPTSHALALALVNYIT